MSMIQKNNGAPISSSFRLLNKVEEQEEDRIYHSRIYIKSEFYEILFKLQHDMAQFITGSTIVSLVYTLELPAASCQIGNIKKMNTAGRP